LKKINPGGKTMAKKKDTKSNSSGHGPKIWSRRATVGLMVREKVMHEEKEIKKKIREILNRHLKKDDYSVGDDENLFYCPNLKTSFVVAVVEWIEGNFFYIEREHLQESMFSCVNNIAQFIAEKKKKYDGIKNFIVEFVQKRLDTTEFQEDQDLFKSGVADSLFAQELIFFLESTFDVNINADALNSFDLTSINGLTNFIYARSEPGRQDV
jgi:acyl carrier protein